jgi:hypothetical protein
MFELVRDYPIELTAKVAKERERGGCGNRESCERARKGLQGITLKRLMIFMG